MTAGRAPPARRAREPTARPQGAPPLRELPPRRNAPPPAAGRWGAARAPPTLGSSWEAPIQGGRPRHAVAAVCPPEPPPPRTKARGGAGSGPLGLGAALASAVLGNAQITV